MNRTYVATFPKDKEDEIKEYFTNHTDNIFQEILTENIVVFKTHLPAEYFSGIPHLSTLFILVKRFENLTGTYFKPIFQWAERHSLEPIKEIGKKFGFKNFRGVISEGDRIISSHRRAIKALERKTAKDTGLEINRVNPDTEIWVTHTRDGWGFVMCKVSTGKKRKAEINQ
jgi:hypothetical protein